MCDGCSAGPRSFLVAAPFNWSADGKLLLVNLVYFVGNARQTAILPYRSEAPPSLLWPRGLGTTRNVISNAGVTTIDAAFTFPVSGSSTVLTVSRSMRSNLYRVPLPK